MGRTAGPPDHSLPAVRRYRHRGAPGRRQAGRLLGQPVVIDNRGGASADDVRSMQAIPNALFRGAYAGGGVFTVGRHGRDLLVVYDAFNDDDNAIAQGSLVLRGFTDDSSVLIA
jgi:hypothetical protein